MGVIGGGGQGAVGTIGGGRAPMGAIGARLGFTPLDILDRLSALMGDLAKPAEGQAVRVRIRVTVTVSVRARVSTVSYPNPHISPRYLPYISPISPYISSPGGQRAQLLPSAFLGPSALGGSQPGAAPAQLPGASPVTSCGPEP